MKQRILFVIPNFDFGGAQKAMADNAELFKQDGHEVHMAVFDAREGMDIPVSFPVHSLRAGKGNNVLGKIYNFWKRVYLLHKLKKKYNVNTSIGYLDGAIIVNIFSWAGERQAVSLQGSITRNVNFRAIVQWIRTQFYLKLFLPYSNAITSVTTGINYEVKDELEVFANQSLTIFNYIPHTKIKESAAEPLDEDWNTFFKSPIIAYCGRMSPEKGLRNLYDVFAKFVRKHNSTKLLIIGDGPTREADIDYINNLGLSFVYCPNVANQDLATKLVDSNVVITGKVSNPLQYVSRSRVFSMFSYNEGFSLAMCEALVLGIPVISTDAPSGPRMILDPASDPRIRTREPQAAAYGWLMPCFLPNAPSPEHQINDWVHVFEDVIYNEQSHSKWSQLAAERASHFTRDAYMQLWNKAIGVD